MSNVFVSTGRGLFFLRKYSWGRIFLKSLASPFILWFLILSKIKGAKHFAIKGSFIRQDWVFGLSDIDLVVIFHQSITPEKRRSATKLLQWWQRLFPFIGDIDYFRDEEFSLWQVLGGVKALQSEDWKWLGNGPQKRKYLYHPLKFRLNVIHELGFLNEWLEYNYFHTEQNEYRVQALSRVLKKIVLNLDWLIESKDFHPSMREVEEKYPVLWKKISLIESHNEALQCYFHIAKFFNIEIDRLIDAIPKEMKKEFEDSITLETKLDLNNFFFRKYWKLLKCSGYFNPDILIRFAEYAKDPFAQTISLGMVHCRLIEGFGLEEDIENPYLKRLHEDITKHPLYKHIQNLADDVLYLGKLPIPLKPQVALISSTWGNSDLHFKTLLQAHEEWRKQTIDFVHIHVVMSGTPFEYQFPPDMFAYHINSNELTNGLWHKESLQNLGGYFARFQKELIFIDSDVYPNDHSYIDHMRKKLHDGRVDLVQGFSLVKDTLDESYNQRSWVSQYRNNNRYWRAPGLIWAMKTDIFFEIGGLNSLAPDGSNDGAFISEILRLDFGQASSHSWFKDSLRDLPRIYNVDYLDANVIHINHGPPRDYVNRSVFLELLKTPLKQSLRPNFLGILQWKEKGSDTREVLLLPKYYKSHTTIDFIAYFKSFIDRKILEIKAPFMHFSSELPSSVLEFFYLNYGFIKFLSNDLYEISIPHQSCANVDFVFKTQFYTLKPGEVLRGYIRFNLGKIKILKIGFHDTLYGRTFADINGSRCESSKVELKNYLDQNITFQFHIFLEAEPDEVYHLDISGLVKETGLCHPVIMSESLPQEILFPEEMLSYFCKDQSSIWERIGNGFDIQVKASTSVFYQHIIRLDLTTLSTNFGHISFILDSTFNIELELFVEDKEGYCLLLTDCSHYKFLAGKHVVQHGFSWTEKTNFPNLYILFRCESPGKVKFQELVLKI